MFKIHMDGNKIRKKEMPHNEFLAEITQKKTRNTKMFKLNTQNLGQGGAPALNIDNAIKSLSPRQKNLEIITKKIDKEPLSALTRTQSFGPPPIHPEIESPQVMMDGTSQVPPKKVNLKKR